MTPLLIISLTFNALFLLAALLLISQRHRIIEQYFVSPGYERRFSFFEALPTHNEGIVFLGDSLTEWFPLDELFPNVRIKNRGISGDTTAGVLRRLGQVTGGRPSKIFLLIGTNDIGFNYSHEITVANYDQILTRIRQESPQTTLYVQTLLPRHKRYAPKVRAINKEIAALAQKHSCRLIDLHPAFADEQGSLRPEFSNDDLHLLYAGYKLWQKILQAYIP
ncbi:MAG: sialate O-acetylesterase [Chloroflexi bacterium]|nr:sialate O-acetylesterase [Chloroflexota bacterium]